MKYMSPIIFEMTEGNAHKKWGTRNPIATIINIETVLIFKNN